MASNQAVPDISTAWSRAFPKKVPTTRAIYFGAKIQFCCKGHLFLECPTLKVIPYSFLNFFEGKRGPAPSSLNQTMSFSPNSDHSVAHDNRIIVCRAHKFVCLPGCQPYRRIFWNLHMRTHESWPWVIYLSVLVYTYTQSSLGVVPDVDAKR
jgi:hypothetical protein